MRSEYMQYIPSEASCTAAAPRLPARRGRCRYPSGGCATATCAATATRFPAGRRRRGSPRGGGTAVPLAAVARRRCCGFPGGGGSATAPALGGGCSAVPRGGAPAPVRRRPVAAAPRAFSAMRSRRHWRSVCGAAAAPAALWQRGFPFVGWSQPRPTFPLEDGFGFCGTTVMVVPGPMGRGLGSSARASYNRRVAEPCKTTFPME